MERFCLLMRNLKNILRQQISILGMVGLLAVWQVMGWLKLLPKFILPTPLVIKIRIYGQSLVLLLSQISLMVKVSDAMESAMSLMEVRRHLQQ